MTTEMDTTPATTPIEVNYQPCVNSCLLSVHRSTVVLLPFTILHWIPFKSWSTCLGIQAPLKQPETYQSLSS